MSGASRCFGPIGPGDCSIPVRVVWNVRRRRWLQHQGLSGPSHRQGAGKYFNTIELVTIAYEVSMDQQYGYGVCCKLVLKYYDYILLLLFVMFICVFSKLVSAVNC